MTLKEKFESIEPNHVNHHEGLIEIADEYVLGFADWLVENQLFYSLLYGRIKTNQLLEMYKKEKGL